MKNASENILSAWNLRYQDPRKALELLETEQEQAEMAGDREKVFLVRLYRTFCLSLLGELENPLDEAQACLDFFEKQEGSREQAIALDLLGKIHDQSGNYRGGLANVFQGLELFEKDDVSEEKGELLSTQGNLYSRMGELDKAIQAYEEARAIRKELKDPKAEASSMNLLARTYAQQGATDKALQWYEKSLELRNSVGDVQGIPWTYLGMASTREKAGEVKMAKDIYRQGLAKADGKAGKPYEVIVRNGIGSCALELNELEEAGQELSKAFELVESIDSDPLKAQVLSNFSRFYERKGETKQALDVFREYHDLKEQMTEKNQKDRLLDLQKAFDHDKKKKEAEIHRLRNVELKQAYDLLEEKTREITDSINYAARIQNALLPDENTLKSLFREYFIIYEPRDVVSGDFYWAAEMKGMKFLVTADCTGHGVPGAFMSMLGVSFLNDLVLERGIIEPAKILDRLREMIVETLSGGEAQPKDGMDAVVVTLDEDRNILKMAGANNPLYLIRDGGPEQLPAMDEGIAKVMEGQNTTLLEVKGDKQSVGYAQEAIPFTERKLKVQKGDQLVFFSDGYADQFGGPKGKKLKYKPFKELLLEYADLPVDQQKKGLQHAFREWKGELEQIDDVCVIGFRV